MSLCWRIGMLALLAAGFYVAVVLSLALPRPAGSIAVIYPPNALALGALVLMGRVGRLPELLAIGAGCAAAIFQSQAEFGLEPYSLIAAASSDVFTIGTTGWLLVRLGGLSAQSTPRQAVVALGLAAAHGPIPGALIAHALVPVASPVEGTPLLVTWWISDTASLLIFLPPFLYWKWRRARLSRQSEDGARHAVYGAAFLALAAAGCTVALMLSGNTTLGQFGALALLGLGFRYGLFETSLAIAGLSAFAMAAVAIGVGLGSSGTVLAQAMIPLQSTLALGGFPALLLAASRPQSDEVRQLLAVHAKRLNEAVAATLDGDWDWRLVGQDRTYSERAASMLGYRPEELSRMSHWDDLVHPEDRADAKAALDGHLAGRTPLHDVEYRCRHRDGHWIWVRDRGKIVERDEAGTPLVTEGTYSDVSERKRMDRELRYHSTPSPAT